MNIGYACITLGIPYLGLRSCVQKNASEENLRALIQHNLTVLERQVEYNIRRGIRLFRISSDLIPFGSSPVNRMPWWEEYEDSFKRIGDKIVAFGMRVSMHPGQYTVLASPSRDVVARAEADLIYHARILEALGTGPACKIVLHVGGVYGDKSAATERFSRHFAGLPDMVRSRLVIENDERSYHIEDVIMLASRLGVPAIYDNLHNAVYSADASQDSAYWVRQASATWRAEDGPQKIHYAQQEPGKKPGAHARRIRLPEFLTFVQALNGLAPDIMLEVKDKDLSAIKCLAALSTKRHIKLLEDEWAHYKYLILERDPNAYQQIRILLKDKSDYPAENFYLLIDGALEKEPTTGTFENAALHVWGYFKNRVDGAEKKRFEQKLARLRAGSLSPAAVKRELWGLAERYDERYLLESLFFVG